MTNKEKTLLKMRKRRFFFISHLTLVSICIFYVVFFIYGQYHHLTRPNYESSFKVNVSNDLSILLSNITFILFFINILICIIATRKMVTILGVVLTNIIVIIELLIFVLSVIIFYSSKMFII